MRAVEVGAGCLLSAVVVLASACSGGEPPTRPPGSSPSPSTAAEAPPEPSRPAPALGAGDHTAGSVDLVVELEGAQHFYRPMDLKFDPKTGRLWVVNQEEGRGSWTIIDDVEGPAPKAKRLRDDTLHFLRRPSSLSFHGSATVVTTCQESLGYDDNRFMGPTVWTTNEAVFEGGQMSHYDMLHESGNCMGVAWTGEHVWWAFNGVRGSLDRNDFHGWHPDEIDGLGGHDHTDGEIFRYADRELSRVPGVPSGMAYDDATQTLYVADTGNGRIVKIDTTPHEGKRISSINDEVPLYRVDGVELAEVVPPGMLKEPSGLALHDGLLYVADRGTGVISAFTPAGERVNWLDTGLGPGHVTSVVVSPTGRLHFLDTEAARLYRIEPN